MNSSDSLRICALILFLPLMTSAQDYTKTQDLRSFDRLVVSPRIDLILSPGDEESIRVEFDNIDEHELEVEQRNNTLYIYLRDARHLERQYKRKGRGYSYRTGVYEGGKATAYVSYVDLKKLVVKGEQDVVVEGSVFANRFRLKMYGEPDVRFHELYSEKLHTTAYGECDLEIKSGHVEKQKCVLYGESQLDTEHMKTDRVKVTSFGDNSVSVDADRMSVTAFGEMEVRHVGRLYPRGLVIGEKHYHRID
ncbi:MAG: DUF2807 domain-containing protein [Saprospiraceae bacterium]|nr:DUF2807 domain-containing protein [Saprospiraceae bacterium]